MIRRLVTATPNWLLLALLLAIPAVVAILALANLLNAPSGPSAFTFVRVTSIEGSQACFSFHDKPFCVESDEIRRREPGRAVGVGDCLDTEFSANDKL